MSERPQLPTRGASAEPPAMQAHWRELLKLSDDGRLTLFYDPVYRRLAIAADRIPIDDETLERLKRDGVIWLWSCFAEEKLLELLVTQAPDIARRFIKDALDQRGSMLFENLRYGLSQPGDQGRLIAAIQGSIAARFPGGS